jgi:hypothetical protein
MVAQSSSIWASKLGADFTVKLLVFFCVKLVSGLHYFLDGIKHLYFNMIFCLCAGDPAVRYDASGRVGGDSPLHARPCPHPGEEGGAYSGRHPSVLCASRARGEHLDIFALILLDLFALIDASVGDLRYLTVAGHPPDFRWFTLLDCFFWQTINHFDRLVII